MAQLNLSLPSFQGLDLNDEKQLRKLTSYLYRLDEQLRYVLNNLGEENLSDSLRAIINAQTDATVLDEMTGQVQRLSTQIVQTAQAIGLKADKATLDALGETLGQDIAALEVTADAIRTEVSDTASGLQSQINQQAGQISLTVQTANNAASAAASAQATANGKLGKEEAAKGVNTGSGILINQNGVYVEGKEIDLRTSDGDEYVHISEAGVSASSITAPNVMPRYDGPDILYVNPAYSSERIESGINQPGDAFRSLRDALASLSNKIVLYSVTIQVAPGMTESGNVELAMCLCEHAVIISGGGTSPTTLAGTLTINGCSGNIFISGVNFKPSNGANGITSYGGTHVEVYRCMFTGNGNGYGIIKTYGGSLYVERCEFYNFLRSVVSRAGAHTTMIECKGNCKINADRGGVIFTDGYMPDSSTTFAPEQSWGGKVFEGNVYQVDQGSGGGSSAPTIETATYSASTASYKGSGSKYRDDLVQGWYSGIGRIRGCMWFYNAGIRDQLRGKTVLSATLRLAMRSNVGRGVSVTVELSGTYSNSGASSATVTKNYGTLGTANPGETVTFTLPVQAVNDLVNGTINGLMLYSSDTGAYKERDYSKNYAVFDGAADSTPPQLTVIYQ